MLVVYGFLVDEFVFHLPVTGIDLFGCLLIISVALGAAYWKLRKQQDQKVKKEMAIANLIDSNH